TRLLFRRTVDRVIGAELAAKTLRAHLGQRRGQRGLAVVDVTDGAHVHVRLGALELTLGHAGLPLMPLCVDPGGTPGRTRPGAVPGNPADAYFLTTASAMLD